MDHEHWLAQRFEENRRHLKSVAQRILGSVNEADDALQETWLRLNRTDAQQVENLGGWLTTVTARVCLDMLRARRRRQSLAPRDPTEPQMGATPEQEIILADATGAALMVVLDRLTPAERVAFVLHDMFDLPFEHIAVILSRTPAATRQLANRARQRLRDMPAPATDADRQRRLVDAFLLASREGQFEQLLALLSPDVVLRADVDAVQTAETRQDRGAPALAAETRGAERVATIFKGRAAAAKPAQIDGRAGAVWMSAGLVRSAFIFTFDADRIVAIDLIMEAARLAELDLMVE